MRLEVLSERLGVTIGDQLLSQALTHRSYSYEHSNQPNNERLEFLGDSVLGFVVTTHLFARFSEMDEGELTKLKNAIVSAKALAQVAGELGLGEFLLLGRGEEQTGGRAKINLLADTFEAVLGAVYVEAGLVEATAMVERLVLPLLDDHQSLLDNSDPKTRLQELAQAKGLSAPSYSVSFEGPDHDRTFFATLTVGDVVVRGVARSRKNAESEAAVAAIEALGGK
jgi:ribonuclease-3